MVTKQESVQRVDAAIQTTSTADRAELREVMGISPSFRALSESAFAALERTARLRRFPAGQLIDEEGTKSEGLYLLLRGEVALFWGETLREVVVTLSRGGVFGSAIILGGDNEHSFAADRNSLVASWDEEALRRAETMSPGLRQQLGVRLGKEHRLRELTELLQYEPLLRNTSSVLRHRLLQESTLMRFGKGEDVYKVGDPSSYCYLIVRGEVEVTPGEDRHDQRKQLIGRGSMFGETDLMLGKPRNESARAEMKLEVLAIDRKDLEALRRACGSFRRALASQLGQEKAVARPQDLILVLNQTKFGTRDAASLIPPAFVAIGERDVELLEVGPESGPAAPNRLRLPQDPAQAERVLMDHVQQLRARYVIIYSDVSNANEWFAEPAWDHIIDHRVSSAVYFTDDLRHGFPVETPQLSPVRYIEVRSADTPTETSMVRSGSIRLVVEGSELGFDALPSGSRTALHRLARTLAREVVGVALGGGSAWGYAHVSLLKGLVEAGIPVDMVAGTSMGSVVACTFGSAGVKGLDTLLDVAVELAMRVAFAPISRKPLESLIEKRLLKHRYLQDMPVPTFPVAADIQTGRARVFRHGRAAHAMFASTALPAMFVPEIQDGVRYVDGGVSNNVPVSALVGEGADFIIASNVIPPPRHKVREKHRVSLTRILSQLNPLARAEDALRSMFLLMHETGAWQSNAAQVTFAPSLAGFGMFDLHAARMIAESVKPELEICLEQVKEQYHAFCRDRDH